MPTPEPTTTEARTAKERRTRTPFPRYERVSERLAESAEVRSDEARAARELEIPRTESYGELWTRAQARRLRTR
jgi:hypothetical protein